MKTRNGFVSNSSSSSFVIIGYSLDKVVLNNNDKEALIKKYAPQEIKDDVEKWGVNDVWYDFLSIKNVFGLEGIRVITDDGPGYIGVVLADVNSDGGYLEKEEISIEKVLCQIQKLQEAFGIQDAPQIITGTRSC